MSRPALTDMLTLDELAAWAAANHIQSVMPGDWLSLLERAAEIGASRLSVPAAPGVMTATVMERAKRFADQTIRIVVAKNGNIRLWSIDDAVWLDTQQPAQVDKTASSDEEVAETIWHTFGQRDYHPAIKGISKLLAAHLHARTADLQAENERLRDALDDLLTVLDEPQYHDFKARLASHVRVAKEALSSTPARASQDTAAGAACAANDNTAPADAEAA